MKLGITGGTGFMGTHLTRRLLENGHEPVLIARGKDDTVPELLEHDDVEFVPASVSDRATLADAFENCSAVAHLAGINLERGAQTYERVHVRGTRNVVEAATDAGVSKVLLSSFLRARPNCGSAYHESKWQAETIVRQSDLDYTILKAGVTYGRGDHMLCHISRWLLTVPVFPLVGFAERRFAPLAIEDLVDVLVAAPIEGRLQETTVAVVGPEELTLAAGLRRVGEVLNRDPVLVPLPVRIQYAFAWLQERVMETPIASKAQVRILSEGIVEPAPAEVCEPLPEDLTPDRPFSTDRIERGLPDLRRYGRNDLRW